MTSETLLITGVAVMLGTVTLNRFLGERNYGSLTPEDKLKLTDAFSLHRSLATYVPIAILFAVIAIGQFGPRAFSMVFSVGMGAIVVFSIAIQVAIFRKLKTLSLPDSYVTSFRLQSTLVQAGNIAAIALIGYAVVVRAM